MSAKDSYLQESKRILGRREFWLQKPIRQRPYKIPRAYQVQVEKEMQEMLEQGIIEPSQSEWTSPIVVVKKKDGDIRICIHYRKLNAVTKRDAYPMPRIDTYWMSLDRQNTSLH